MSREALSTPGVTHMLTWPAGWRLPVPGESVRLDDTFGGFVEYLTWDVAAKIVRIRLR